MTWHGFLRRAAAARALALTLIFAVSLAHGAPPVEPLDPEDAFRRARVAFEQGEYDAAIALLQAAQGVAPRAVYVFNIARCYEEKGFLRQAYDHFVLYPSQPRTTPELLADAKARAAALAPLLHRAVVDLRGVSPTTLAAVDGALVPHDPLPLSPGLHTLCLHPERAARPSCWTRDLTAGRRVPWPPEGGARGRVALPPGATVTIDGRALPFAPEVAEVELDAGVHAFEVSLAGARPRSLRIEVVPGALVTLHEAAEAPEPAEDPWPWVLVGVGSAGAAAGVGLLVAALVESRPLSSPDREDGVITSLTQAEARDLGDKVDTLTLSGAVLTGTGVALATGGLLWRALEPDANEGAGGGVGAEGGTLWIGPTSFVSVGVGGTF